MPSTVRQEREAKARAAREAGRGYDIAAFVRKMERLYALLHETSRATHRKGALQADLSFLDGGQPRRPVVEEAAARGRSTRAPSSSRASSPAEGG